MHNYGRHDITVCVCSKQRIWFSTQFLLSHILCLVRLLSTTSPCPPFTSYTPSIQGQRLFSQIIEHPKIMYILILSKFGGSKLLTSSIVQLIDFYFYGIVCSGSWLRHKQSLCLYKRVWQLIYQKSLHLNTITTFHDFFWLQHQIMCKFL